MSAIGKLKARLKNWAKGMVPLRTQLTSVALRRKFAASGVEVGLYSYGCFDLDRVPPGTTVGRYCSLTGTSRILLENHGVSFIGLTTYLYNTDLGVVDRKTVSSERLEIGDDVWIGHHAILLPNVQSVGRGAIIAAGAVVTKPVPPYAIVAGNPARLVRYRFDEATIAAIEATRWWEKEPEELKRMVVEQPDLIFDPTRHFALKAV